MSGRVSPAVSTCSQSSNNLRPAAPHSIHIEYDTPPKETTTTMKVKEATLEDEINHFKVDLENRDPTRMNRDLKVNWLQIVAEPDPSLHSIDCVWVNSYKLFELTKLFVYRFLSILCGLPIALCLGCTFACFSFNIIWCLQPSIRIYRVSCFFFKQLWAYSVHIVVRPLTYAMGGCLSTIRVHNTSGQLIVEDHIV